MKDELKKQYALRIAQANNVEMILIAYEMTETYLDDALTDREDSINYCSDLNMAKKCIDELLANLHYDYELSKVLKKLYIYMKNRLRDAEYNNDYAAIEEVKGYIDKLHDSYESIKSADTSEVLMKNTQAVVVGMTYGKNKILDELSNDVANRGFLI